MKKQIKNYHNYPFKCSRIGNSINPKLVNLLENPADDPIHIKRNPEYAMDKDGIYSPKDYNSAVNIV